MKFIYKGANQEQLVIDLHYHGFSASISTPLSTCS